MKILKLWNDLKERIKVKKEKLVACSLLSRIVAIILVLAISPSGIIKVSATEQISKPVKSESRLQFDVQKVKPVYLPEDKSPQIVLSESEYNRKEREEKERQEALISGKKATRTVITRESANIVPADASMAEKRALAKRAASKYGIDWRILEAVWQVESGKAWNTSVNSYAGAQGPMQFMRGTWNKYAVDGNSDGSADINVAEDAVYAGANLLAQAGAASGDVNSALFSYNHAQWYVEKVKAVANSIQE